MTTSTAAVPVAEAEREFLWYEGLRSGHLGTFAHVATELDPVLRDLAVATTGSPVVSGALAAHAWEVALGGLDLFAWRCSLRAWLAGVLVGVARQGAQPEALVVGLASRPARAEPGRVASTDDWADLPWGRRWSRGSWDPLERARARLPRLGRQVIVLADVHGWGERDTADALGLTRSRYATTLGTARLALHDALEVVAAGPGPRPHCGHDHVAAFARPDARAACPGCAVLARRWDRVSALLATLASPRPEAPDRALLAVFRRWRASRRRGLLGRLTRAVASRRGPPS
jgi:DNA-directed RNA polymerase specialized sigma24 family protein